MCTYPNNGLTTYGPQRHELKCDLMHFADLRCGCKQVEVRKDDRGFRVGDTLFLQEWDGVRLTGNVIVRRVSHVLRNFEGLAYGYVALSLERM